MDRAAEVLVIITSAVLSVFLILGIYVLIRVLMLIKTVKQVANKAEKLAESAEAIGSYFQRAATPIAISKFISNVADAVLHHDKKRKRGGRGE